MACYPIDTAVVQVYPGTRVRVDLLPSRSLRKKKCKEDQRRAGTADDTASDSDTSQHRTSTAAQTGARLELDAERKAKAKAALEADGFNVRPLRPSDNNADHRTWRSLEGLMQTRRPTSTRPPGSLLSGCNSPRLRLKQDDLRGHTGAVRSPTSSLTNSDF